MSKPKLGGFIPGRAWRRQAQLDLGGADLVVGAAARRARQMYGEARAACMAAHACAAAVDLFCLIAHVTRNG